MLMLFPVLFWNVSAVCLYFLSVSSLWLPDVSHLCLITLPPCVCVQVSVVGPVLGCLSVWRPWACFLGIIASGFIRTSFLPASSSQHVCVSDSAPGFPLACLPHHHWKFVFTLFWLNKSCYSELRVWAWLLSFLPAATFDTTWPLLHQVPLWRQNPGLQTGLYWLETGFNLVLKWC